MLGFLLWLLLFVLCWPLALLALVLAWLSFEVRRWFHAPDNLHFGGVGTAENYTYSVIWLLFALSRRGPATWRHAGELYAASRNLLRLQSFAALR